MMRQSVFIVGSDTNTLVLQGCATLCIAKKAYVKETRWEVMSSGGNDGLAGPV